LPDSFAKKFSSGRGSSRNWTQPSPTGTNSTSTTINEKPQANHSEPPTLKSITNSSASIELGNATSPPSWYVPNRCRRRQIVDGQWVPEHLNELPYQPPSIDSRCRSTNTYDAKEGWDTHKWVPNEAADADFNNRSNNSTPCHYTDWNKCIFCELAKYATVMIVGDSLSWEHYMSLVQLLGVPTHHGYQHMSRLMGTNIGHAVCEGWSRLVYRRDDYLTQLRHALLESESNIPQVLVLNRGAHYAKDKEYLRDLRAALDVVEEWQGRCDFLKIKCHFFWRTTVPGHRNCKNFTHPVNDKVVIEAYIANLSQYDPTTSRYHWYDFQHQNRLAESELRRRRMRHRVLDGYHINVLRPDDHSDCLHSCYPGKMDVYPQLMLHYLRGDRSTVDVDHLRSVFFEHHWNVNKTTEYVRNATQAAAAKEVAHRTNNESPTKVPK
jgi:hypothetical protein